jgi:hypothetical protein
MELKMYLESISAQFAFEYNNNKTDSTIIIDVRNKGKDTLKIGDSYIFTSKKLGSKEADFELVDCKIRIKKINDVSKEDIKKLKLVKNRIGTLYFSKGFVDLDFEVNATLVFYAYVDDELYNLIYENILNKNKITEISFTVDNLEFGDGFDGRDKVWKIVEDKKQKHQMFELDIKDMNIFFNPLVSTAIDDNDELSDITLRDFQPFVANALNTIKIAVIISAVAAALAIFARLF